MVSCTENPVTSNGLRSEIWLSAKTILHNISQYFPWVQCHSFRWWIPSCVTFKYREVKPSTWWVPESLSDGHQASEVGDSLSLCVLPSNTSSSGSDHPPPFSACSYVMTLNLEPLSIFCPEHKSLRFFLLFASKAAPEWLSWSLLSAQINMLCRLTERPVHQQTLHSGNTLSIRLRNKHMAVPDL